MKYYSIRFKLTAILIFIVGFVIYFTWFLNNAFAESYYISSEKENIVSTFQRVKDVLQEASSQDTINEEMEQISNSTNIKMMIAQSSDFYFTQVVIFSNLVDGGKTYEEILGYLDQIRSQVILGREEGIFDDYSRQRRHFPWENTEEDNLVTLIEKGYFVTQLTDRASGQKGIYLFGFTDDDYLIAMRGLPGRHSGERADQQPFSCLHGTVRHPARKCDHFLCVHPVYKADQGYGDSGQPDEPSGF